MDAVTELLIQYGYWGMAVAAFLAGTAVPFNAEIVMAALSAAGLNPTTLVCCGTLGSVCGCMTCFFLGYLGKMEWLHEFGVKQKTLERAKRFVDNRGAWMAVFSFLPIIGNGISITLGLMRANKYKVLFALIVSRALLYSVCAFVPKIWF